MKKLALYLFILSLAFFSACSSPDSPEQTGKLQPKDAVISEAVSSRHTENSDMLGYQEKTDEPTESPDSDGIASEDSAPSKPGDVSSENRDSDNPGLTEPSGNTADESDDSPTTSQSPKTDPPKENEVVSPVEPDPPEPAPVEPEPVPDTPKAGAEDVRAVAEHVLSYLNEYRVQQGSSQAIWLSGLTSYAELRSVQLVSNFAHDTNDQRQAATQLQYGEYVDPALFGRDGEPYYRANAREAIAKAGCSGTVQEVAQFLARIIHESPSHWAYIGSSEYGYMAVGITYRDGTWYCDVAVASENTDAY